MSDSSIKKVQSPPKEKKNTITNKVIENVSVIQLPLTLALEEIKTKKPQKKIVIKYDQKQGISQEQPPKKGKGLKAESLDQKKNRPYIRPRGRSTRLRKKQEVMKQQEQQKKKI